MVGVGVEPSTGYLDGSGVSLERGAVLVDERFESSVQGVYAVGDLAYFHDPVFGHRRLVQHWTNANYQGERLGRILAGEDAPYDLVAIFFSEVFGTRIGLLGDLDAGCDELVLRGSLEEGHLIGFYGREHVLVAALVSGQTPEVQGELTHLLRSHATLHDAAALREHSAPLAAGFHRTAACPRAPRRLRGPVGRTSPAQPPGVAAYRDVCSTCPRIAPSSSSTQSLERAYSTIDWSDASHSGVAAGPARPLSASIETHACSSRRAIPAAATRSPRLGSSPTTTTLNALKSSGSTSRASTPAPPQIELHDHGRRTVERRFTGNSSVRSSTARVYPRASFASGPEGARRR